MQKVRSMKGHEEDELIPSSNCVMAQAVAGSGELMNKLTLNININLYV
jgi:hypothetical protein